MDDKRTLMAFLLVGVIFLLMPFYYEWMGISTSAPEPELAAQAKKAEADSAQWSVSGRMATRDEAVAIAPPLASETSQTRSGPEPERFVEVVTARQRLRFSTVGGTLVSSELSQYSRAKGGLVQLVVPGSHCLGLQLESEDGGGAVQDLRNVHFEPDVDRLDLSEGQEGWLRLRTSLPDGHSVERTYHILGGEYGLEASVRLTGFSDDTVARLTWERGIALAERDAELDVQPMRALAYWNETLKTVQVDDDESDSWTERGDVRWAGVRNKYFLVAVAPLAESRHRVSLTGRPIVEEPFRAYEFSVATRWGDLPDREWRVLLYSGPLDLEEIAQYERDFARAMDLGFPVVRDIAKILLRLFVAAYEVIPNYGWIIVVFGLIVKLLVYPLTHKSYESAAKMQDLQPKLVALREKHKNNNQRLSQETMKLYREEGVNPLGGCLPLVLQMPIFIAMYQVFSSAIQLRQTPWILWVRDLSLPDDIAVAGYTMHALPLLMAASMFFQSKMTMKDPKQAALVYVMPVVMVFVMWSFSSGLVLYWTVFNILQIGQQQLTNCLKQRAQPALAPARK
ncbi:MAG: Membrane protein insertase YidC [Chloroflexi bacterium]|nr:Membrane protein insertase YidC [Chloroflexota bacterium]